MKAYAPDIILIVSHQQEDPTSEDLEFMKTLVKDLRNGKRFTDLVFMTIMLDMWPYLMKRFGISRHERKNWKTRTDILSAKQAVRDWKKNRNIEGMIMLKTYVEEHLPMEELNMTRDELVAMVREMEIKSAKDQLAMVQKKEIGASVGMLMDELHDAKLSPDDIGTTSQKLKVFAVSEAREYVRQIREEDDRGQPFGGIVSLMETGLITWKDIGMTEKEFDKLFCEQDAESPRSRKKKKRELVN